MSRAAQARAAASQTLDRMTELGLTLAVAESLTGGLLSAVLTDIPGASAVLRGAVVPYATDLKTQLLGVSPEVLVDGPVAPAVAQAMAVGAQQRLGADLAVATTGVAGPQPQSGQPVGQIWLGFASAAGSYALAAHSVGTRTELRWHTVTAVLAELNRILAAPSAGHPTHDPARALHIADLLSNPRPGQVPLNQSARGTGHEIVEAT